MTRRTEDAGRQVTVGRRQGEGQNGSPERGAALLWIAALAALAVIGWMVVSASSQAPPEDAGTTPQGRETEPETPEDLPAPTGPLEDLEVGPRTVGTVEARPAGRDGGLERVFVGVGSIMGQVRMADGSVPPQWTVHLEPSLVGRGRDSAVPRTLEASPNEETFEMRDVPLGAYRIYAAAPGYRSTATELALYKLEGREHLPGVTFVNVTLTLKPMASVDGIVRRSNGDPADALDVFLLPTRTVAPGDRLEAKTDLAGVYRFDAVPAGSWLLCVGHPTTPLVSPRPTEVGSTGLELDPVELPPLATLDVLVVDEAARPFPDVDLVGYLRGAGRGSIRGRTGPQGRFRADYLQPGPWRVEATYTTLDYKGKRDWLLEAGVEVLEREIIIR